MQANLSNIAWEAMHAPYDQPTYQAVLNPLKVNDVILDIGARQMAQSVQRVYAVEINAQVLDQTNVSFDLLPANLIPICADARALDFPPDVTSGVLLMRHCTCFCLYADKLQKADAARLITNARWRMSIEVVDLHAHHISFTDIDMGWYACLCGGTGFKEGSAERWTFEMDGITNEVSSCLQCVQVG